MGRGCGVALDGHLEVLGGLELEAPGGLGGVLGGVEGRGLGGWAGLEGLLGGVLMGCGLIEGVIGVGGGEVAERLVVGGAGVVI